ncbi:hypothetical protein [Thioclava kandeliae]|uniref:Secreted protein n=1 Tax=Thioclava kandeliae TaxID=3070818 RepID=A0ABV1SF93_9RHOB
MLSELSQLAFMLFSLLSRAINVVAFGGDACQTTSSRAYIEGVLNPEPNDVWERRARVINRLVFWQPDHCRMSWLAEVERANRTLEKNLRRN